MRKRKYYGKRSMLNLPGHESTASITAEIEDTSTWKHGKTFSGDALEDRWHCAPNHLVLKISDCSRSVDLSLSINTEARYNNSLHKIETMIEALESLKTGLSIERARYTDRMDYIAELENEDD